MTLQNCFGKPLEDAIQGLELLYNLARGDGDSFVEKQVFDAYINTRQILSTLARLERERGEA